jgi:hypothetical protein
MRAYFCLYAIVGSDVVFGKRQAGRKRSVLLLATLCLYCPVYRSQIEPMVGPQQLFLPVDADELSKESTVKTGILTDKSSLSSHRSAAG